MPELLEASVSKRGYVRSHWCDFFFSNELNHFHKKGFALSFGLGNGLMITMFWLACVEETKRGMGGGGV